MAGSPTARRRERGVSMAQEVEMVAHDRGRAQTGWHPLGELSLLDVENLRLLLRGDSSIDWHRLNFQTREEVDQFLRVHLFEPDSPRDRRRIRVIHDKSVQYLRNHFALRLPPDLERPRDVQDLFLYASYPERRFNRRKLLSCMILKVMSIIHHLEARALVFRTSMSDADIFNLVHSRIGELRERFQRIDAPVVDIYGSRKSQDSLISKLLSKRETFAATVFDKFRYRVVVNEEKDILPVLADMMRNFMPFNYVLPGQAFNNLFDPAPSFADREDLKARMDGILSNYRAEEGWGYQMARSNEFSANTYKMINLIADLPVQMEAFLTPQEIMESGHIGFALIELQVVDARTEATNEFGDNSHDAYKARRKERVLERLRWGGRLRAVQASRQAQAREARGELLPDLED